MSKATAIKFYTREVYGQLSQIMNAREEISRGKHEYGVGWKFEEVSKEEFLKAVEEDKKVCCIKTMSGKYKEVEKDDLYKFNI